MAEHPAGHMVLKWLIEQDAQLTEREGTPDCFTITSLQLGSSSEININS